MDSIHPACYLLHVCNALAMDPFIHEDSWAFLQTQEGLCERHQDRSLAPECGEGHRFIRRIHRILDDR